MIKLCVKDWFEFFVKLIEKRGGNQEDSHNNDPSAQRNRSSRSRSASISKDVDTLLQSFEFKKIDEEVDKFFVNLVNENLPQSVIRMYDDGKEES